MSRLFVAVVLTDEARHALAARLDGLVLPGRRVAPQQWHVTLRFIGAVDDVSRDRVVASLDQADLGETFRLKWGELGAFPRAKRATVLWVGLAAGAAPLQELGGAAAAAVTAAGLPAEDRPFRPHLTLSRIRPQQDVRSLLEAAPAMNVPMPVDRIALFRSHLDGAGSRYELLESFALR